MRKLPSIQLKTYRVIKTYYRRDDYCPSVNENFINFKSANSNKKIRIAKVFKQLRDYDDCVRPHEY